MKFIGRKVVYETAEIEKYAPLWRAISSDVNLKAKQKDLSQKVFWASDAGLSDGTDPLLAELKPFSDIVRKEAVQLEPALSAKELHDFVFYVLHHCGDLAEYDVESPPKSSR
jgi:hypothetical protein